MHEVNSGADYLIQFIRSPKPNEISSKIYNIFKLVDHTFSHDTLNNNERIQRFINFIGITMIYFLLEPFFDKMFDIPQELRHEFLNKRIETLNSIFQYLKRKEWQ
jgi:hypothetical protein